MDQAIKHREILKRIDPQLRKRIVSFMISKDRRTNFKESALIITNVGLAYRIGQCFGQSNDEVLKPIPIQVPSLEFVAQGEHHTVMVTKDGQLYGIGYNDENQLALGLHIRNADVPTLIEGKNGQKLPKFVSVRCGEAHTVALTQDGQIWCCGKNTHLNTISYGHKQSLPFRRYRLENFETIVVQIACGSNHSLALTKTAFCYSWGDNHSGQLGRDNQLDRKGKISYPFQIELSARVKDIAAGKNHTLLLTENGQVYACGDNRAGQLGQPIEEVPESHELCKVSGLPPISRIASHFKYNLSLAMTSDQTCYAWGLLPDSGNNWVPVKLPSQYATLDSVLGHYGYDNPHSVFIQDYHDFQLVQPSNRLCRMFDNPNASDVHFVLGSQTIYALRSILVHSSSYFALKFSKIWFPISDDFEESIVQIPIVDHSYETFYAYIRFLYTDSLPDIDDSSSLLDELYELANFYQEPELKHRCLLQMKTCLSTDNCCHFYQLTQRSKLPEFEQELVDFIKDRYTEVSETAAVQFCTVHNFTRNTRLQFGDFDFSFVPRPWDSSLLPSPYSPNIYPYFAFNFDLF